ncbi:uncharacterized protein GLRG_04783 [Colletotrichum graminicola M1.001]|uniref:Uncharacterized protein n=1 Tax=Colletotrichum graminicola (strain M1.001 / M2 / FGSC 10212) TaxID=645133 RepID=E3QFK1_COLGM|nr:uncharacterized protein GLRG_04783 [Colletotrichum graminicola M1.001]EFQ29639.1 hypothetical protein GLRG_04783 [Colletotrichum graminicola M1.001]
MRYAAPFQLVTYAAFILRLLGIVGGTQVTGSAMAAMSTTEAKKKNNNMTRPDPMIPLTPVPLTPSGAGRDGQEIVRQLTGLTRSGINGGGAGPPGGGSRLRFVKRVELEGGLWEPEGIVRLAGGSSSSSSSAGDAAGGDEGDGRDERFWVSAGEYTVPTEKFPGGEWVGGTDRTAGAGFAHLVVFDGTGRRLADWVVSEEGDLEYHNGGLDYDGRHIWATLSQYRPNTTGTVVRIDPAGLTKEAVLRVGDHQGGIVHDVETGTLTTLNWGGRKARRWDLGRTRVGAARVEDDGEQEQQVRLGGDDGGVGAGGGGGGGEQGGGGGFDEPQRETVNPSYWVDYQDCKSLGRVGGRSLMLCSGIATAAPGVEVGGLAVVDAEDMVPVWEAPFMERTGEGVLMTKNPMDVALVGGRVRLYFAPEEGRSAVYVYEVCEG